MNYNIKGKYLKKSLKLNDLGLDIIGRRRLMTKEKRAEKWFRGIPNAELISMEEKMDICDKAAREMMTEFF